jgi:hypothetical protein
MLICSGYSTVLHERPSSTKAYRLFRHSDDNSVTLSLLDTFGIARILKNSGSFYLQARSFSPIPNTLDRSRPASADEGSRRMARQTTLCYWALSAIARLRPIPRLVLDHHKAFAVGGDIVVR